MVKHIIAIRYYMLCIRCIPGGTAYATLSTHVNAILYDVLRCRGQGFFGPWGKTHRHHSFGIPEHEDLEAWKVKPGTEVRELTFWV